VGSSDPSAARKAIVEITTPICCRKFMARPPLPAKTILPDARFLAAEETISTVGWKCLFFVRVGCVRQRRLSTLLRAAAGPPAYGQVTIMSAQEVVISACRDALVLDNDGELHTIPEGKNYRVTMEFDQPEQQAPAASTGGDNPIIQPRERRRSKLAFYLIFTGAMAGIIYAIWDHLSESPSTPR
jgi:hypothetical protein